MSSGGLQPPSARTFEGGVRVSGLLRLLSFRMTAFRMQGVGFSGFGFSVRGLPFQGFRCLYRSIEPLGPKSKCGISSLGL